MNKEVFDSMREQMKPGPEVRAALNEKLARPAKRRTPVRKYVAVAACAALVIGGFSVYSLYQDQERWMLITRNFHHDAAVPHLHSYVTVENATSTDTGAGALTAENGVEEFYQTAVIDRDSGAPNTGDLSGPEGTVEDVPVQEGAEDYQRLMAHFNGTLPDWYGGGYLDDDGRLVVLLVEGEDPGDKSLELQVQDWTGSDRVRFSSAKYSLNHLKELMDQLNQLPDTDLKYADVMAGWGIDEERNRIELTLTQAFEPILSTLAELDPDDDAIYVQVGQRAAAYAGVEDPASTTVPGGTTVPEDDENLTAIEPWVDDRDGAWYGLPEEEQPAVVQSVPEEEELDPSTAVTYDPRTGKTTVRRDADTSSKRPEDTSGGTRAHDPGA